MTEVQKIKKRLRNKLWRRKNSEWLSSYREENKEQRSAAHSLWRRKNLTSRAESQRVYRSRFPGASQMRSRVANFLSGKKNASTPELLGCELDAFGWWIEAQLTPDMTWENYGSYWEVDHIVPLSWFDQTDILWQHKAFHFTNTQPLRKLENRAKGNRHV